jgi:hypothetical protein
MNTLTLLVIAGAIIWWYKPLRVFLIQRTNRTVKVLLIVLPGVMIGRVIYNLVEGKQDDMMSAVLLVIALVAIWGSLIWIGNFLERRRPTKVQAPDLAMLSKLPGMPRIPGGFTSPAAQGAMNAAANPEVQRAAREAGQTVMRAAVRTAAQVDTKDVAGSLGRIGGRWVARARKNMATGPSRR